MRGRGGEEGRGKGDRGNGTDGTGHGMGWGESKGKRGRGGKARRGAYSPQTSIPGATTADLDPISKILDRS